MLPEQQQPQASQQPQQPTGPGVSQFTPTPKPKSALAKYGPYIAALVIIAAIVAIALH